MRIKHAEMKTDADREIDRELDRKKENSRMIREEDIGRGKLTKGRKGSKKHNHTEKTPKLNQILKKKRLYQIK